VTGLMQLPPLLPDPKSAEAVGWGWLVLVGIVGGAAAIIGLALALWALVDRIKGRRAEPTRVEQPVSITMAEVFVTEEALKSRLVDCVRKGELHDMERRLETRLEENFRDLDGKRSRSIGNLHEHLTIANKETHQRIDALAETQGQLVGEMRHIATAADKAAAAAQAAAVEAARAGEQARAATQAADRATAAANWKGART
jgi:hypothetical protein